MIFREQIRILDCLIRTIFLIHMYCNHCIIIAFAHKLSFGDQSHLPTGPEIDISCRDGTSFFFSTLYLVY